MKYYFRSRLGETRYEMSDGGLLCKDVPIARTGEQIYISEDLPDLEPGEDGKIIIERTPDEVFSEETLASFEGMSLTIDHPSDINGAIVFVDPTNWQDLAMGHIQNVRRGEGLQSDLIVADLVVKRDIGLIAIENGLSEVSCGYDAKYEQIAPGRARQTRINGNHVALVNKGRAGSRCAIGDKDTMPTQPHGLKGTLLSVWGRIAKTADAADLAELEPYIGTADESTESTPPNYVSSPQGTDQGTTEGTGDDGEDRMSRLEAKVDQLAAMCEKMMPAGDSEDDDEMDDPTADADSEQECGVTADSASRAEMIVPGFAIPKAAKPTAFKRSVLAAADKGLVSQVVGDADIDSMPDASIDIAYRGVSELARKRNLTGKTTDAAPRSGNSAADFNKQAQDFWAKH